jgi:hypothetical protein
MFPFSDYPRIYWELDPSRNRPITDALGETPPNSVDPIMAGLEANLVNAVLSQHRLQPGTARYGVSSV